MTVNDFITKFKKIGFNDKIVIYHNNSGLIEDAFESKCQNEEVQFFNCYPSDWVSVVITLFVEN